MSEGGDKWIYIGFCWLVMGGSGYILTSGGWWWVMVGSGG